MEGAVKLDVPLTVDLKSGDDWESLTPLAASPVAKPMPELPEVETIARELRPLVVGRTIVDASFDWPNQVKHPAPEEFVAAGEGPRDPVGRQARQVDRCCRSGRPATAVSRRCWRSRSR